jgi:molecular chaperone DnaK
MGRVIGIDLGTTNSCVAAVDERGTARVLVSAEGERTIPSTVSFTDDNVLVGIPALRQQVTNPTRTITGAKRLIGRKVNSDEVSWFARMAPFRIVAAPNGDAWIRIDGSKKSPQEVASHVLRRLRQVAEDALGEPVTRAVVTVPAYFNDAQRKATKDAGTIAGLDVVRILNEPTAAALAYGAHRVREGRRTIAVFDLGGGTFDVSIMAVDNGVFEVLATNGDPALGGDDWDRRIIEQLSDEIFDRHRIDLAGQAVPLGRLREAVERAKRELSTEKTAEIRLPYLCQDPAGEQVHVERSLSRDEAEQLTRDLLDRLAIPCQRALADAGLGPDDIEEVLLVGGMTRWPSVQGVVSEIFGKKPSKGANPDEVVATGAAAYAAILSGQDDDAALLDVTPHTLGVRVGDAGFAPVIPRNSMLPVRERRLFATSHDDQRFVRVEIYQGESEDIRQNRKLGQVLLEGLPPGPSGSVRIELTVTVDVESILHVAARELSTGRATQVSIQPSGGLSSDEILEIVTRRRSEDHGGSSSSGSR